MKKFLTILLAASLSVTMIISQTGCSEKTEPVEKDSYYLDTMCRITIYDMEDMSEENAGSAIDKAFSACSDYERLFSPTIEGSDIWNINHAGGKPVECNPHTAEVIKKGIEYGKLSGGRFDISIGKVSDLWDFHNPEASVPSEKDILPALETVDYSKIRVNGNTITMEDPDAHINLGGIGKGYIADRAGDVLESEGVTSAIVNLGGDVVVIGNKFGEDFKIGVEKPFSGRSEIVGAVSAKDATIVTSGTYERYIEGKDGKIYHHILDVNTGYSAETDIDGVTIISSKGKSADCDALSTICLLLGTKDASALIESLDGYEAVFIDKDGNLTKTKGADSFSEM